MKVPGQYALVVTNFGHELDHRRWSPTTQLIVRWLSSFSFDSSFSIERVYEHRHNVATREDHRDRCKRGKRNTVPRKIASTAY